MTIELKTELDKIVKTIADTGMASKIILFGSAARGDNTPESDIDLCVLTPITDRRPRDITVDLRLKLWDVQKTVPLDLLTYNHERFEYQASRERSFESIINNEGVVLYEE
jgi:predicted nucleotidyltransferase